jgi:uncharacterized protein YprB with RNaseH-like and TPR domain
MPAGRRDEIAALLRKRIDELRLRDGEVRPAATARPWAPAARARPEVQVPDASGLRDRLVAEHAGRSVAEALGARQKGAEGLLEVAVTRDLRPWSREPDDVTRRMGETLWLLPGVRDGVAARLVAAGHRGIATLLDHPRFGADARRIARLLDRRDAAGLMDHVAWRASRGHPLALRLAGLFDAGDLLFLDIETMGLFGGSPIVVAGLAAATGSGVAIRQVIASTPSAEAGLVAEVASALDAHAALVTFNGRAFDLPYVCGRAAFYGAPIAADPVHFDLLPFARRLYARRVPDCRLDTLARHVLGVDRGEDVPGSLVPAFYRDYLEDPERRAGLLVAIASHNLADMEQMVRLFAAMMAEAGS